MPDPTTISVKNRAALDRNTAWKKKIGKHKNFTYSNIAVICGQPVFSVAK